MVNASLIKYIIHSRYLNNLRTRLGQVFKVFNKFIPILFYFNIILIILFYY